MTAPQNIIALIYDFDETLSPNNMQEDTVFKAYGIDKDLFWKKATALRENGYERTLAYLRLLMLDEPFKKKPVTRESLKSLASEIQYYPGIPQYFSYVEKFMRGIPEVKRWNIQLEHYIISSGMLEILEGTSVYKYFKKVYACEYEYQKGVPVFPKLVINDTNKTQFLFRINKGTLELTEDINTHMPEEQRRVPFRNMVYIGDSETDIPSMTVIQRYGGHAIAVFNPAAPLPPQKTQKIISEKRADHFAAADYRPGSLLLKIIETTLKKITQTIAYHSSARMSLNWVLNKEKSKK